MKKTFLTIACAIALVCLFSVCILAGSNADLKILIPNVDGEEMSVSATDGVFYLPSSVDLTKIKFSFDGEIAYTDGKQCSGTLQAGEALDITACKTTDERGAECYRLSLSVNGKNESYTFYHDATLSSVFVSTSQGLSAIDADKEARDKNARIVMLNPDG